jgi:hypothetical protein
MGPGAHRLGVLGSPSSSSSSSHQSLIIPKYLFDKHVNYPTMTPTIISTAPSSLGLIHLISLLLIFSQILVTWRDCWTGGDQFSLPQLTYGRVRRVVRRINNTNMLFIAHVQRAGLSIALTIEQSMVRVIKSRGGLTHGPGMTETLVCYG